MVKEHFGNNDNQIKEELKNFQPILSKKKKKKNFYIPS